MNGLANVIAATAAFVGTHFLMSHPLRRPMAVRLGERGFLGVYTVVSLLTFGWMVWALMAMGPEPFLWTAPGWAWPAAALVMLLASILLAGSLIGNPALPGMPAGAAKEPRGVFAITRHPMMWAFALWALVHLALWPQPSVVVLTLGILILALGGAAAQDTKKTQLMGERWTNWVERTSFLPFTGTGPVRAMWPGWGVLLGGLTLWVLATWAHARLGAPSVGVWR